MDSFLQKIPSNALSRAIFAGLGLACYLRLMLRSHTLFDDGFRYGMQYILLAFAFFIFVLLGTWAFLAYARSRIDARISKNSVFSLALVCVCSIGYGLLRLVFDGPAEESNILLAACAVVYAAGLACALVAWGGILFQFEQRYALIALALCLPFFALLGTVSLMPFRRGWITASSLAAVLMVPSWFFAFRPTRVIQPRTELSTLKELPLSLLAVLVVGAFACCIANGVLDLDDTDRSRTLETVIALVLPTLICVALLLAERSSTSGEKLSIIVSTLSVVVVIVMLFIAIGFTMTGSSSHMPSMLLGVADRFCLVGCLIALSKPMHEKALSPSLLFSLFGIFCIALPMIVGNFLVPVVDSSSDAFVVRYASIIILVVSGILICVAFLTLSFSRIMAVDDTLDNSAELKLQDTYQIIADGYDLTPREKEVMQLIAEGNSMKKVGELLFISLGTVQSHAKKIYRKLDIHSKQELMDLIEKHKES